MEVFADDTSELLDHAARGDADAIGQLLLKYRPRLRRMVTLRMDPRLQGRLDESDVVQEACLEATQRIGEYFDAQAVPFFVWLRFLTAQKLAVLHRRHIQSQIRDVRREVPLWGASVPAASSEHLAAELVAASCSPSDAAHKIELRNRLQEALERMDVMDREVLALRHFEQLSNVETAHVLEVNPSTASTRYVRALQRLRSELGDLSGLFDPS